MMVCFGVRMTTVIGLLKLCGIMMWWVLFVLGLRRRVSGQRCIDSDPVCAETEKDVVASARGATHGDASRSDRLGV